MSTDEPRVEAIGAVAAGALVAYASGSVLTLEILSLRLVAPYVGLTLQTSTAVIGFALAAIATGAWAGGWMADRVPPQRLVGPAVLIAGALMFFVGPAVRWTGEQVEGTNPSAVLLIAALAVFAPALLLSAVTPMVVKLRLASLSEAGTVVGRLSGIATVGALAATFGTGFLLVGQIPTSVILLVLGGSLVIVGAWLTIRLRDLQAVGGPLIVAAVGVVAALASSAPCDVETAYHCARVVRDEERPTGRILELDTLSHSYVDLADPTYLHFSYIRGISALVDEMAPQPDVAALHLGGGGMTLPRYLDATRPTADNLIFEIDPGVVEVNVEQLGRGAIPGVEVRVQDARVGLAAQPDRSRDLVIGDAFSGLTVPWHLTTREAIAEVRRVLDEDGLYALNLIDYPPLRFARAEVVTMLEQFPHVAVIARPPVLERRDGGNLVVLGSERPIPEEAVRAALAERAPELQLLSDRIAVSAFAGGAPVLRDDFAPVDQLHTPYPRS